MPGSMHASAADSTTVQDCRQQAGRCSDRAGACDRCVQRQAVAAVTNLIRAMHGEPPLAQINPEVPVKNVANSTTTPSPLVRE